MELPDKVLKLFLGTLKIYLSTALIIIEIVGEKDSSIIKTIHGWKRMPIARDDTIKIKSGLYHTAEESITENERGKRNN